MDNNRVIPDCKLPLLVLAMVLSIHLVLGDRSEFVYTASVVLFAYTRYYKKITLPVLIVGLMSVAFLMSAIQLS